jgi:hypothetical protein
MPDVEPGPAIWPDGDVSDGRAIGAGVAESSGVQAGAVLYAVVFDPLYLSRPLAALLAVHDAATRREGSSRNLRLDTRGLGGVCSYRRPATTPSSLFFGMLSAHAEHGMSAGHEPHSSIAAATSSGSVESYNWCSPRHSAPGSLWIAPRAPNKPVGVTVLIPSQLSWCRGR